MVSRSHSGPAPRTRHGAGRGSTASSCCSRISHKTIARWLEILERIYAIFRLAPFGAPRIRALKKAQQHYHFDWKVSADHGPRCENVIAAQLLKWVRFQIDSTGQDMELRYFRDPDGREVDFVMLRSRRPLWLAEARWSNSDVAPGLRYLKERFPEAKAWQISATGRKDYLSREGIRVTPALELLSALV